jgi:hypothetical protein
MSGSMPLLFHTISGGTEGQFYPFSYSPILTKISEVQNELGRFTQKCLSQEEPVGRKLWNGLYKELIKIHKFRMDVFSM